MLYIIVQCVSSDKKIWQRCLVRAVNFAIASPRKKEKESATPSEIQNGLRLTETNYYATLMRWEEKKKRKKREKEKIGNEEEERTDRSVVARSREFLIWEIKILKSPSELFSLSIIRVATTTLSVSDVARMLLRDLSINSVMQRERETTRVTCM